MIRYLKHDELDLARWDAAIDASPAGMVYAKSWYLNIVSPGWEALVEGDYHTVFPLTTKRKYGFSYLHQPFFTQQLGIFSSGPLHQEKVEAFIQAIPKKIRLVEIQLNHSNAVAASGFSVQKRLTHHLSLESDYALIHKKYSENLRRNLKKAQQHAFTVTDTIETNSLTELFRANRGQEVETLKSADYEMLNRLVAEASSRNLITKSGITINNSLEAGAIFIESNNAYIFLFSATGELAKTSGAMAFIIDRFISTHCLSKKVLDFEGSMDPGLARFYKSFGSEEVVYLQIRKNNLPLPIRWLK